MYGVVGHQGAKYAYVIYERVHRHTYIFISFKLGYLFFSFGSHLFPSKSTCSYKCRLKVVLNLLASVKIIK